MNIFELANTTKCKVSKFRLGETYLFFLKTKRGKLLNDGYSMDNEEAIEFLQARLKKISGGTEVENNA